MKWKIIHIAETDSTNRWLREYEPPTDAPGQPLVVWADYQTAGKGQGTTVSGRLEQSRAGIPLNRRHHTCYQQHTATNTTKNTLN